MVSLPKLAGAESRPLAGLQRSAAWDRLWRRSPSEDRFAKGAVEARIRGVFHLDATDPLPLVHDNTLRDYHAHLARCLSFPFRASHCEEAEPLVLDSSVLVTGLCDPVRTPPDSVTGVLCEVVFRNTARLPLALLKVDPRNPNRQMIDDYWYWFWNCR
ncbi:MAG: hypothetical protein ABSF26_01170 [Thermoguttaceae bacterium]|jgi:hypothetical protein